MQSLWVTTIHFVSITFFSHYGNMNCTQRIRGNERNHQFKTRIILFSISHVSQPSSHTRRWVTLELEVNYFRVWTALHLPIVQTTCHNRTWNTVPLYQRVLLCVVSSESTHLICPTWVECMSWDIETFEILIMDTFLYLKV